jgi:anaerobic magnesium-protoporphyrin IX monomethyl ester cyclase
MSSIKLEHTVSLDYEALKGIDATIAEKLKASISKVVRPDLDVETLPRLETAPKRVLFIVPPGTAEESMGALSAVAGELPMLGLAYIAAALRDQGHDVKLIDYEVFDRPLSRVANDVRAYQPDVVGMTAYITNMRRCASVASEVKKVCPDATVILGGPQVSIFPEEGFVSPDVDIIVMSEGEVIICNVMNALGDEDKLRQTKGIWFRTEEGEIVKNPPEGLLVNLDTAPRPALDLFPMDRYFPPAHIRGKRVAHLLTSRGCPFKCTFCETKLTFGRSFRYHSTERVIQELESLIEQGYDGFQFYDDIFTANKRRVIALCEAIIERGWKIKWMCYTRTNTINDEILAVMKKAGCYQITFGGESGDDDLLKIIKKDLTVATNYEGFQITKKHGILTSSSFMLGLPTETAEQTRKTVDFAVNSGLDYAIFPITEPYPGTELWIDAQRYGYFDSSGKYRNNLLSENSAVWIPNGRTRHELEAFATEAFRRFYFRPRQVWLAIVNFFHCPIGRASRYLFGGALYFLRNLLPRSTAGTRY